MILVGYIDAAGEVILMLERVLLEVAFMIVIIFCVGIVKSRILSLYLWLKLSKYMNISTCVAQLLCMRLMLRDYIPGVYKD